MPLSVFNPSLYCLLPFRLVLYHFFKVMSLVGILPLQGLINYGYDTGDVVKVIDLFLLLNGLGTSTLSLSIIGSFNTTFSRNNDQTSWM